MKRISLLYTRAGGGHLSLSQATLEALNRYCRGKFECQLFDPFPQFYTGMYKRLSTQMQTIWKLGYQATDMASLSQPISYLNRFPLASHLHGHFHAFRPDIVISNNAFISAVLPSIMDRLSPRPLRVVHFADPFSLHNLWMYDKSADLYLSPTPEASASALAAGIPASKVKTIGWITREKFLSGPYPSSRIRPILGLDANKFTLFIGGAGQGVDKSASLLNELASSSFIQEHCQAVVNTGLNPQLASKVLRIAEKHPSFFHVIPYAHNMPYLLSAADIAIGKAGPNFMFEAIQELKPLVAIGCLPGQEEGNLDYVQSQNLGWVQQDLETVPVLVEQLAKNPKLLNEKIASLKKVRAVHANAPRKLAAEIMRLK